MKFSDSQDHSLLEVSVTFFKHFCVWAVSEGFLNSRKFLLHSLLCCVVLNVTINLFKAVCSTQNVLFHILIYCAGLAPCWLIILLDIVLSDKLVVCER